MIYALAVAVVLLAALSIYLWRKPNMDIATLNTKLAAATAAADAAKAKITADEAEIATLQANQADPAALQNIADGLDAITAKLS